MSAVSEEERRLQRKRRVQQGNEVDQRHVEHHQGRVESGHATASTRLTTSTASTRPRGSSSSSSSSSSKSTLNIRLGPSTSSKSSRLPTSSVVSSVFNVESSSSEDEMPEEARMRMRNVGKYTVTPSGPNSFGKTNQGFVDANKLFERNLRKAMDAVNDDHHDDKHKGHREQQQPSPPLH